MYSHLNRLVETILMSTHSLPILICKNRKHPKSSKICSYGSFFKGLKNEFEIAVVNEPSVFEPLKFYCIKVKESTRPWVSCNQTGTASIGRF